MRTSGARSSSTRSKWSNGRVPVLVGAVDPTTQRVIEHARAAKAAGADGIVVTAPFYARTSQAEIVDHFRFIRDAVDIPLIAYDIPVCVHAKLERATVATLMREGVIAGLKDSSGDEGNFRYALMDAAERPDFFAMTGAELTADCALLMGAHGIVPGLANVDPHAYVRLYEAAGRGDWAAARAEQEHLCRLFEIVRVGLPRTSVGAAGVGRLQDRHDAARHHRRQRDGAAAADPGGRRDRPRRRDPQGRRTAPRRAGTDRGALTAAGSALAATGT